MVDDDTKGHEAPSPIPIPPDFPVTWMHPEDEHAFWEPDRMHFPEPITPLTGDLFNRIFNEGFEMTARAYELPIRLEYRYLNSYNYMAVVLRVPPDQAEAQGEKAQEKLKPAVGQFIDLWNDEWLPEVKKYLADWEAFDLRGSSVPALLAHLDETITRATRLWDIHMLVALPFLMAQSMFDELYEDLFGKEGAFDAYRLLQGFGNLTVDSGHALWALSRQALASPELRKVLEETYAADVPTELERSAEGRAFLSELGDVLEEYGQRSDIFAEFGDPNWIENPTTPIKNIQDYLGQPDRDLATELTQLADARERAIEEARERIKGYPQPVIDQFEFLLNAAQQASILQEDHNYWIDQRGTYKIRRVLLEFGRRLSEAGVIDQQADVFYLMEEETRKATNELPQGDFRQTVAERKSQMDHFRTIQPPSGLGTSPHGPPPDDPLSRAIGKFFGPPPKASEDANVVNGNAGAPGKVSGTAKVVLSLAEAHKIQPGDIMIAPATMPAWTPLFATIAAVVTDAGGILSHAAIVAREYNIPAVLGTGNATSKILDGQTVEVDGNAGVVRILS